MERFGKGENATGATQLISAHPQMVPSESCNEKMGKANIPHCSLLYTCNMYIYKYMYIYMYKVLITISINILWNHSEYPMMEMKREH